MRKIVLFLSLVSCFAGFAQDSVMTESDKLRDITRNYITDKSRPNDFAVQGDGTVLDKRTGLQWMQCSLGQSWENTEKDNGECTGYLGIGGEYTLELASQPLSFAGYDDWRLPTKWELETLLYCGGGEMKTNISKDALFENCDGDFSEPVIVQDIFPNTAEDWYITSTPSPESDSAVVAVNFSIGGETAYSKDSKFQVRLVRQPK